MEQEEDRLGTQEKGWARTGLGSREGQRPGECGRWTDHMRSRQRRDMVTPRLGPSKQKEGTAVWEGG